MPNNSVPFYPSGNTRLIDTDPQIVKVAMDTVEWGSRKSAIFGLANEASIPGGKPSNPSAPEMTVKHTG
jgi:hypothetical protein